MNLQLLTFLDLIKNSTNSDEYDDVSYDAESLFTSISVEETINYASLCSERNQAFVQEVYF